MVCAHAFSRTSAETFSKNSGMVLPAGRSLPRTAEGRAPVSWTRPHSAARGAFPPPQQQHLPSSLPAYPAGFAPPAPVLAQHQQPPPAHNALGGPLDDDEDYVIIDGPSPFSSGHASMCAAHPCSVWASLTLVTTANHPLSTGSTACSLAHNVVALTVHVSCDCYKIVQY